MTRRDLFGLVAAAFLPSLRKPQEFKVKLIMSNVEAFRRIIPLGLHAQGVQ